MLIADTDTGYCQWCGPAFCACSCIWCAAGDSHCVFNYTGWKPAMRSIGHPPMRFVHPSGSDAAGDDACAERSLARSSPPVDPPNLFHLLEAREMIERETARLAVTRRELRDLHPLRRLLERMGELPEEQLRDEHVELDIQFHLEIARLSRNEVLLGMLETTMAPLRPRLRSLSWEPGRRVRTQASHTRLYVALVDGDVAAIDEEMRSHLRQAYDSLLEEIRLPPAVSTPPRPR